jgi:hypothetical protein
MRHMLAQRCLWCPLLREPAVRCLPWLSYPWLEPALRVGVFDIGVRCTYPGKFVFAKRELGKVIGVPRLNEAGVGKPDGIDAREWR